MNDCEELLTKIQNLRLKAKMIAETYEGQIEALSKQLEAKMKIEGLPRLSIDIANATWRDNTQVEVKDWNAVMEYVYANKAFDVLQKRVAPAQLAKRIKDGAKISGVTIKKSTTFVIKGAKESED